MNCPKCGTAIPPGSAFCHSCGTATQDPTAATVAMTAVQAPPPQEDPLLVMVRKELEHDYVIEKELGRGGMAVVYMGKERSLEREVAIKVLPPEMALQGGTADRFKREARLAAALDHQNIIPVYRVGQAGPLHYIAMKYVRGRGLDSIIEQQGALPVPVVWRVLRDAASGLAYAHEKSIVHRDIKGANIMIEQDGRVLVSDFGIARAMTETSLTASGMVIGTPNYMSPEQCGGSKVGPQSDQYSLGILAFQMLTGALPFEADSIMGIIQHHYMTPPPDIRTVRDGVPEELLAILYKALEKKPENRFKTTQEMADYLDAVPLPPVDKRDSLTMLKQLSHGEKVAEVRTGTLPPLSLTASITGGRPSTAAPEVARAAVPEKKNRWLVPTLVVAVLGLGAGVVWQFVLNKPAQLAAPAAGATGQAALQRPPAGADSGVAEFSVTPRIAQVQVGNIVLRDGRGRVPAGTYDYVVSATGYNPDRGSITVSANQTVSKIVSLRRATTSPTQTAQQQTPAQRQPSAPVGAPVATGTASVLISVTPANADVTLDGRRISARGLQTVSAGPHTLNASATDCQAGSQSFTVAVGETGKRVVLQLTCTSQP